MSDDEPPETPTRDVMLKTPDFGWGEAGHGRHRRGISGLRPHVDRAVEAVLAIALAGRFLGCCYQPCADQASRRGQQRFVDRSRTKSEDSLSLSVTGAQDFTHD